MKGNCRIEMTDDVFDFCRKFNSGFGVEESSGEFSYSKNDTCYIISDKITDNQLKNLIKKSLNENHDFIFDIVGKKDNEIIYDSNKTY